MTIAIAALLASLGTALFVMGMSRVRASLPADGIDEGMETTTSAPLTYRVLAPVMKAAGGLVERVSPRKRLAIVNDRITYAGLDGTLRMERVLSYKAACAVGGLLLGLSAAPGAVPRPIWALAMAVAASFMPDMWLDTRAKARQENIARDLPEALDLMAITVEAGLGLEQALAAVTSRLSGALGEEFHRMLREIELGVSRHDSLSALRMRTDVPELSGFVAALIQADRVGAPIADVLRVQAAQVRMKRRQRAREKAGQTPVKILFPVIFCILPALFVVVMGPGAIRIMDTLFTH